MLETDFVNEANNAEEMRRLVSGEPRLRDRVYIPQVYRDLSTKRVMTAEWIEGVRLWDQDSIEKPWYGGWRTGSPGTGGKPLPPPSAETFTSAPSNDPNAEELKPARNEWRGRTGKGGLGVPLKSVMQTIVDLFSAQMFLWGTVHCDPHPGNIFIRRKPNGEPEVVLIDHGLYVYMDPKFRQQYALLWKSLMSFDNKKIIEIAKGWGINAPDFFASATLMRPYSGGDNSTRAMMKKDLEGKTASERSYAMQQQMRAQMREMLADEKKWPRELIFIGRELRILQGLNQRLGTPVNRLKITGLWASRALAEDRDLPIGERTVNWGRHLTFRLVLLTTDLAFWYSRIRQWIGWGKGLEDDLEESMRKHAKDMGVELNHSVFDG
jgi:aarF domain-containing kinase